VGGAKIKRKISSESPEADLPNGSPIVIFGPHPVERKVHKKFWFVHSYMYLFKSFLTIPPCDF